MDQIQSEAIQKIELFISCRQLDDLDTLSVSDPFVRVYLKTDEQWRLYGRTELIWNNLNPNFAQSILIDYHFEVQQYLRFEVHHFIDDRNSKIIGYSDTTVSAIVGAKDQILLADLINQQNKCSGKLIVKADQVKMCNDEVTIQFAATNVIETRFWFWNGTNPFLRFYRLRKDDGNPVLVHQTEHLLKSKNPIWQPIQCKSQKLCNGDYLMPIKIELWDYRTSGNHVFLGETSISIEQMQKQDNKREIRNKKKNNELAGQLLIQKFVLRQKASLFDYLAGGLQLNLIVAIDFTASNKSPLQYDSLHYCNPNGTPSQYEQAIVSVGQILINYDYDKKVPVFGFGSKPYFNNINTNQTLHSFPLNDNPSDPEVYQLEGILDAYRGAVKRMQFDGPTYLHPVISEAMKAAQDNKDSGADNYLILLILTDGETHDLPPTIDDIIASSLLPLSIIIIGIGRADFSKMEILDNDDMSMVDKNGRKAIRDLVQFVPYEEFKGDAVLLAKEVLAELPDQVVEYMELTKQPPKPPNNMRVSEHYRQHQQQQQQQQPRNPPPPVQQQFQPQQKYLMNPNNPDYHQVNNPMEMTVQQSIKYTDAQAQQVRQHGIGTNALSNGMAQQGFLKPFLQQAGNQNYNYPPN